MEAAEQQTGAPILGLLFAVLAAVLFAVGAVLQHEAAELSSSNGSLSLRRLIKRRRWMLGQTATVLGTGGQVAALAVAPVAVVQPVLAVALVVGLGLRAVRTRQVPLRLELIGAVLTTGGLGVFLVAAQPAAGADHGPRPRSRCCSPSPSPWRSCWQPPSWATERTGPSPAGAPRGSPPASPPC